MISHTIKIIKARNNSSSLLLNIYTMKLNILMKICRFLLLLWLLLEVAFVVIVLVVGDEEVVEEVVVVWWLAVVVVVVVVFVEVLLLWLVCVVEVDDGGWTRENDDDLESLDTTIGVGNLYGINWLGLCEITSRLKWLLEGKCIFDRNNVILSNRTSVIL